MSTYYGNTGYEYLTYVNEDMGLFKIDQNPDSSNGTSVGQGHYPEIYYYL